MVAKRHHRCNLCGKDFDSGEALRDHLERRHPEEDIHLWEVAEIAARDLTRED